jgi:hypothetical protein
MPMPPPKPMVYNYPPPAIQSRNGNGFQEVETTQGQVENEGTEKTAESTKVVAEDGNGNVSTDQTK